MKSASPSAESPPEMIGAYRIEKTVGTGGMGEVYRGYDERLDRHVALKRIKSGAQNPEQARERFRREARALARVRHPSVVEVYDWIESDDSDWLVMEFLEGQPLSSFISDGPVDLVSALRIVRDIADGLAAVHAHGIVHRDLKPGNVMLIEPPRTAGGTTGRATPARAKLLDFGLAKRVASMDALTLTETISQEGQILGTVTYMSPEQAAGRRVEPRADIFSLGVLLYEMLTGVVPFRGDNAVETLTRICTVAETPIHRLDPTLPMAISGLVGRMLRKEPEHRLQRAEEVSDLIGDLIAGLADGGSGTQVREALLAPRRDGSSLPTTLADGPFVRSRSPRATGLATSAAGGSPIRTLLLNDLVDSTRLVEQLGDERAARILEQHDRVARDLLQQTDGREIDKSDGFLMLFDRPLDAVRFALGYHAALADMSERDGIDVSSRVGIHVGEVVLPVNSEDDVARGAKPLEVEGLAKATAARFMSLAGGRQTLISRGVYDLARRAAVGAEGLPDGLAWAKHGRYRMKGIDEPVEVFEVGVRGASALSPPRDTRKAKRVVEVGGRLSGWRLGLALAAVLVLVVLAGLGGHQLWLMREVPASRYVAVPATQVQADDGAERALEASAIRAGLVHALQGYADVAAIEPSRSNAEIDDPVFLATALGADETLLSELQCLSGLCQIHLKRVLATDGTVTWSHRFTATTDNLLDLSHLASEQVRGGFPDVALRPGVSDLSVLPEDYAAWLSERRRYDEREAPTDEVLARLDALHETSPGFVEAYLSEAQILRLRFFETRETADQKRALEVLGKALEIAPDHHLLLRQLALTLIEGGRLDEAAGHLDQLGQIDPGDAQLFALRAMLIEKQGDGEQALATMREAVRRQRSIVHLISLSDMAYRQGGIDAARTSLEAALEIDPDRYIAVWRLARLELVNGDLARGAALYEALAERSPEPGVLTNLGVGYLLLERYDDAARVFEQALESTPDSPFALLNLADAEALRGQTAAAERRYRQTLEQVQSDADPDQLLTVGAQALAHLGRPEEAVAAVQKALRRQPDSPKVVYEAALVYALVGERTSALLHARHALEIGVEARWLELAWFDPLRDELSRPANP